MLTDTPDLRDLLAVLLPGLKIEKTPLPSGQRVVYFSSFGFAPPDAEIEEDEEEGPPFLGPNWGKTVVKVSRGMHPTIIARLEKEIQILKSLNSPHYPKLYWSKTFTKDPRTETKLKDRLFVTIEERINSNSLAEMALDFKSEASALRFLSGLTTALIPLWEHPSKLVHRDLKPHNILIKKDGTPAIIDLGIVREEGQQGVTGTYAPCGPCTALYASPEQVLNDKLNITFRSDFFSIGTLTYELITGFPPFGPADLPDFAILDNVVNLNPPSLHKLGLTSAPFSDLIEKMMSKEPYKRHRTINTLINHINSLTS